MNKLRDDLERYQQELSEERVIREQAEERVVSLEQENQMLKHSVEYYKTQLEVYPNPLST